jgi:hypothetical protein
MTIAIAGTKFYTGTAATSHLIDTWGFSPTSGDLLVLAIQSGSTFPVTSGWTRRLTPPVASVQVDIWDQIWTSGSSVTIANDASAGLTACLMQVTGAASVPFDVKGDSSTSGADPVATQSGSTTQNDELVIATFGNPVDFYTTPAPTNGFTVVGSSQGGPTTNYQVTVSQVVSTTATYSTSVHSDSSVPHSQGIVSYKASTGPPPETNYTVAGQFNIRDL